MRAIVTGMPRAGLDMLASLLCNCGIEVIRPTSPTGLYKKKSDAAIEDSHELNLRLLSEAGGEWDCPPQYDSLFDPLGPTLTMLPAARKLLHGLRAHEAYALVDSLYALTLPLWRRLITDLKTVVLLRRPLEVAESLKALTGHSVRHGLLLWQEYYSRIMGSTALSDRLVSHFDAYFVNPRSELERVLRFMGVEPDERHLEKAWEAVLPESRHQKISLADHYEADVPDGLIRLYLSLSAECGDNYQEELKESRILAETGSEPDKRLEESLTITRILSLEADLDSAKEEAEGLSKKLKLSESRLKESGHDIAMLRLQIDDLMSTQDFVFVPRSITFDKFVKVLPAVRDEFPGKRIVVMETDLEKLYQHASYAEVIPYRGAELQARRMISQLRKKTDWPACGALVLPKVPEREDNPELISFANDCLNKPAFIAEAGDQVQIFPHGEKPSGLFPIREPFLVVPRSAPWMTFQQTLTLIRSRFPLLRTIVAEANTDNLDLYPDDLTVAPYSGDRFHAHELRKQLSEKVDWRYCAVVVIPLATSSTRGYEELLRFAHAIPDAARFVAIPGGNLKRLQKVR